MPAWELCPPAEHRRPPHSTLRYWRRSKAMPFAATIGVTTNYYAIVVDARRLCAARAGKSSSTVKSPPRSRKPCDCDSKGG